MMKYDTYKPSEIQWFNQVPLHWETFRFIDKVFLKHGFQFRDFDFTDEGIKVIKISQLNPDGSLDTENCSFIDSARLREFKSIRISEGDILMALTGGTIGKIIRVGKVSEPLLQNYRVGNFFPNKKALDKTYLYFLLSSQITEEQINYLLNRNGQPNIGKESFKNMFFPLPPMEEQTAIAQYLDAKTQAIDKKINLLTKKAETYKELRKSIINDVVCKGLDKNVKLKESGIDWIGQIPEHWEVKRLKALGEIETSSVNKKIEEDEELVKLVNYTDVYGNMTKEIWNSESYMVVSANKLQLRYKKLRQGDVLFTPSSETIEDIGVSAVVMEDLKNTLYSYHILRLKFAIKMQLNFKKYLFNNDFVQEYFSKSATGTTRKILGLNTFYNLPVVFPPTKEEQTTIANYLDEKTQKIDAIVINIGKQIDTLKELRKTLINDVVTGKIMVNG